jgi:hypothetical protein
LSFISDIFSSDNGSGHQATSALPTITQASTGAQADTQYGNAQQGLNNQNAFLQAVQAQNGIGNQSNVYNQLQGVSNGTGANPAQAMLNQQTSANVANQAALQAGQRGAGANVGLMARNAGMQGANLQQQAVGQGATMQANQSLNALGQMGTVSGQQVSNQMGATNSYSSGAQNEQQNVLNGITGQNNAIVGNQSNLNNNNTTIAAGNAKAQQGIVGGLMGGAGSLLGLAHGGQVPVQHYDMGTPMGGATNDPNAPTSSVGKFFQGFSRANASSNNNNTNASAAPATMASAPSSDNPVQDGTKSMMSGIGKMFNKGASSAAPTPPPGDSMSDYTNLKDYGLNSQDYSALPDVPMAQANGIAATDMSAATAMPAAEAAGADGIAGGLEGLLASAGPEAATALASKGGRMPNMGQGKVVPPGEKYLNPQEAKAVASGKESIANAGKIVPGKAPVKGDSRKNDIVPATLEEGGLVIPRSHMSDMASAINFVHQHMHRPAPKKKVK